MEFYTDPNFIRSYRKVKNVINSIKTNRQLVVGINLIDNFKNYWISKGFSLVIMDSIYLDDLHKYLDRKIKTLNPTKYEKLIQEN